MDEKKQKHKYGIGIAIVFMLAASVLVIFMLGELLAEQPQNLNVADASDISDAVEKDVSDAAENHLFQQVPDTALLNAKGEQISLLETGKEAAVLLFWASWCPHCKDSLVQADTLRQTAENYNAQFLLVNKLDGEKETMEQALQALADNGVEAENLFDEQAKLYQSLGLKMIPTVLVLDSKGRVISMSEGSTPIKEQLEDMILEAENGKASMLSEKIIHHLQNPEGGIRTNYLEEAGSVPSGKDVLSESQGIMMEYAAFSKDAELFQRLWTYTESQMLEEGLVPWVISEETDSKVNALVDDLRIIGALREAVKSGQEYTDAYEAYLDAVYSWNTKDGRLVDFYDAESGRKAQRFTLCYGDLAVLADMEEQDKRFEEVYHNTLDLILNGRISEKFPLYYSYYDYHMQKYEGDRLNMAESLLTLLHLAEADKLPKEALEWIEREMDKGCIYAAYDIEGNPAKDGYYESTAVYALVTMIALAEGREELAGRAVTRMEQFRIWESGNELNGLFGNSDGTGIYSFDQGMALLAYQRYEGETK